jgi:hypothetical protein
MSGRTIRLYLVEGLATGMMTAEIINWTGKALVVPRVQLPDLARRPEARRPGVYILQGPASDNPLQEHVYIGESENVWERLRQHSRSESKEFWLHTVFFISKDENQPKAHVRYLESRLVEIGHAARRATLENGTAPPLPSLPEADVADMEFFLTQIQLLLPVLGFNFALPAPQPSLVIGGISVPDDSTAPITPDAAPRPTEVSPLFVLSSSGTTASGQEINGEFVVLRGSLVRKQKGTSITPAQQEFREQLRKAGKLADSDQDAFWVFTDDVPFQSPSAAATIILGTSVNGRLYWKTQDTQQTYKDWQESLITAAEQTVGVEFV